MGKNFDPSPQDWVYEPAENMFAAINGKNYGIANRITDLNCDEWLIVGWQIATTKRRRTDDRISTIPVVEMKFIQESRDVDGSFETTVARMCEGRYAIIAKRSKEFESV